MGFRERQDNIENTLESMEKEVERHVDKICEIEHKLQSIEAAISNISSDEALGDKLESNRNEREREKQDEKQNAAVLERDLAFLLSLVNEGERSNDADESALEDLREIGENVSDAELIVEERKAWAAETKKKIDELMQRLGGRSKAEYSQYSVKAKTYEKTRQEFTHDTIGGHDVLVFDHPRESAKNAIYNQGSASGAYKGTCGLCALGTVLRKAGFNVNEGKMISFAAANGYCAQGLTAGNNGGTSPGNLRDIAEKMGGLTLKPMQGQGLLSLAGEVESGKGVIVGVRAGMLNSPIGYDPYNTAGHWVVLESVIRDVKSKDILGFMITDSNGDSPDRACQYVSLDTLSRAYSHDGCDALITEEIIW